jgi:DnaK suppressor protein
MGTVETALIRIKHTSMLTRRLNPEVSGEHSRRRAASSVRKYRMPLTPQELETLRACLRALRVRVGGAVSDRLHRHGLESHEDAALPNRREDTDDDAAAESATTMDIAHVARDAEELAVVDAALGRIAAGDYGECVDCGEDIAHERLSANPSAARCTECQERSERAAMVARRTRA